MPTPNKGESRNDFVARCVPIVMGEGADQEAAVGKCEGIYSSSIGQSEEIFQKVIKESTPTGPVTGQTTPAQDGHRHAYALDPQDGNGKAAGHGHVHSIQEWLVEPADGHTHLLDRVAQGAEVEAEHGLPASGRIKTAIDHLKEHPNYYSVLASVGLCRRGEKYLGVSRENKGEGTQCQG